MTWAGEFVGAQAPNFNELLAVGYFRTQSMSVSIYVQVLLKHS